MAMVGFSFTKISAERKPVSNQPVKIESNAGVTAITEMPVIDAKKIVLKFEFTFVVKYEPNAGNITLSGEVVELYDKEFGSKVLSHWKSEKKIHADVMQGVFNTILSKSNTEAIIIGRDLGLPSPVKMPRVDAKRLDAAKQKSESKSESKAESKSEKAKK
ncbi:MAG: hypothetical protein ACP5N1_05550 [Candidatus Woesearchaeota archaeon]